MENSVNERNESKNHVDLDHISELLEEVADDNVALVESINRVCESQDALRSDIIREIGNIRNDWQDVITFQALKDICTEMIPPLTTMETMLKQADFADTLTIRRHMDSLALTIRTVLSRMGAERIPISAGEEVFDPAHHLCVRLVTPDESPFPTAAPRTVIRVVEDGFTLAGRILVPAKVEVQSEK